MTSPEIPVRREPDDRAEIGVQRWIFRAKSQ